MSSDDGTANGSEDRARSTKPGTAGIQTKMGGREQVGGKGRRTQSGKRSDEREERGVVVCGMEDRGEGSVKESSCRRANKEQDENGRSRSDDTDSFYKLNTSPQSCTK
jgi:hypothetical protein